MSHLFLLSSFPSASYFFCCRTMMVIRSYTLNFRGGSGEMAMNDAPSSACVAGGEISRGEAAANAASGPFCAGGRWSDQRSSDELCAEAADRGKSANTTTGI